MERHHGKGYVKPFSFHAHMLTHWCMKCADVCIFYWCQVRDRCRKEWTMFQGRMANAEHAYFKAMGIDPSNSTTH